jgi:hypothetical protein
MTSRLAIFVVAVAAVFAGCAPTRVYYQAPQPPPPMITEETKPYSAIRLASVTPALVVSDAKVMVDRHYKEESRWLVTSMYTTRTATYITKGSIVVIDRDVQFGFGFLSLALTSYERASDTITTSPLGLSFLLRNGSTTGVVVDWNAVTLLDGQGRVYGVLHRGVKMNERASVMAPSTIPPGAILEDFVYPKDLVSFSGGRYGSGWLGERFFEQMRPGDRFSLYLPVKRGPETVEYQFKFEVLAPETTQPASH